MHKRLWQVKKMLKNKVKNNKKKRYYKNLVFYSSLKFMAKVAQYFMESQNSNFVKVF